MSEIKPLSHYDAIQALCDCASTVTVLSYQEAIEGYMKLRGMWPADNKAGGLWYRRWFEDQSSRDRASDACASVQRERDEAREMLGNGVRLIERAVINTPDQYKSWHASAKAFLSRYEGEVK